MTAPLAGIRVLELSRAIAGPWCATILADLGAEVIKVEDARGGDTARAWGPFDGDRSLYFDSVNRGKRSLALNLRAPGSIDLIRELIGQVDVLLENFRPGVMTEMGLDPDDLRRQHPGLIVSSVSGYGRIGPERESAGLDQVAQGMSGLMSVTGPDAEHIYRFGVPIVDELAGLFSAVGVLASLVGRGATGDGARVETSLLEAGISAMVFHAQQYLSLGEVPVPQGNHHPVIAPYGAFQASDGPLTIAVGTTRHWEAFCTLISRPELVGRPEFVTGALRKQHYRELATEIERGLQARSVAEWLVLLKDAGIPCGPIYTIDQTFADPQVAALNLVDHLPDDAGRTRPVLRSPLSIDGERPSAHRPAPTLGAQSEEILAEYGIGPERIEELRASGALHTPSPAA